jgi:hypothetical protein
MSHHIRVVDGRQWSTQLALAQKLPRQTQQTQPNTSEPKTYARFKILQNRVVNVYKCKRFNLARPAILCQL